MSKHLTRQQIADMAEKSTDYIRRHEKQWGLDSARSACRRPIEYFKDSAEKILRNRKVIP